MRYLLALLISTNVFAGINIANDKIQPFKLKDYPMKDLVKDYAELMNLTVSFPKSLFRENEKVNLDINSQMTKEEFQQIVFNLLNNRGYTPIEQNNITWIYNTRDIRYLSVPIAFNLDFPSDSRYRSLVYRLKFPISSMVARNLRPYMSRYGRVIDFSDARTLIINDASDNLKRLAKTIDYMDTENTYNNFVNDVPKKKEDDFNPDNVKIVELETEKKILEKKYQELKEKEEFNNMVNSQQGAGPVRGTMRMIK